ncbi:arsenical pump-driving ATPase [Demequina flava]|uniref:arsenical pump-driving ATPase n=1 Tax=Demequina flava TaxID=1095025 RepID=UPI00078442B6|nr:arsenical pump-driving ATPase [Demequina flava]
MTITDSLLDTDTDVLGDVVNNATRYLFFTGKGGVGKTSTASAVAVALADLGRRVLIVSTDPASNLGEVLDLDNPTATAPQAVPGVDRLWSLNVDPVAAAATYRENVVAPFRGVLPDSAIAQIEEELSGSCTVEVAGFNEFVGLLADAQIARDYDHVVFDTAPTGHTLRLLSLPAAWTGFLETNTSGVTCVGPVSALGQAQESYSGALAALADEDATTIVLVARAERATLEEAARASRELHDLNMSNQRVIVNGVLRAHDSSDPIATAWQEREAASLAHMPEELRKALSVDYVPLMPSAPVGIAGLRELIAGPQWESEVVAATALDALADTRDLSVLVHQLAESDSGVVMTMGKGGVGKTTVAAAVALGLAERGLNVTLTTTDPAAHVNEVLSDPPANLEVTRIDPVAETAEYTAKVLAEAGEGLDEYAIDLLAEDLRSPCTEEVAVFHAFARAVAAAGDRIVVIDTAPTGHTLLLLDSSRSFENQMSKTAAVGQDATATLFETLTDPAKMRVLLVALPEATPVHEAQGLQEDLARAGIRPLTWVVNQSLARTDTQDPVLVARAQAESRWLSEVHNLSATAPVVLPWVPQAPRGTDGLAPLLG